MNYSYAEMKKMQKEAFERVKEMQRRADLTARQAREEMGTPKTPPKRVPDEPKRMKLPVEFPPPPAAEASAPSGGQQPLPLLGQLAALSDEERENALLLTLLFLLNGEGADKELLLALVYILGGDFR